MVEDTIVALATPPGMSALAVIRMSGEDSVKIADKLFSKNLLNAASHTLHFGKIHDTDGNVTDEVLVSVMLAPKSYTGENSVEISCHGSMTAVRKIILSLIECGARQARAGEFTKRAFLNGKMDLCRSEAVIDIIHSKSELALEKGIDQLSGSISEKINEIRDKTVYLAAAISSEADFPDEGVSGLTDEFVESTLTEVIDKTDRLLETSKTGKYIRDGIAVSLTGRPNAGKSSVLNTLSGEQKAIVTNIPGTTRDTVEDYINIGNICVKLMDTAGIRNTDDEVEKIGVSRARSAAENADLILYVADASTPPNSYDIEIIDFIKDKNVVMLLNKEDISSEYAEEYKRLINAPYIYTSALCGSGFGELKSIIEKMFETGKAASEVTITNIRHADALTRASKHLHAAYEAFGSGVPADFMAVDIEAAVSSFGEITGMSVSEEIVDTIFKEFCVGK